MNALTLTGNLVADPELAYAGETPVCEMRVAVDNGKRPTTYIDVRSYGEHAFACAEYLHKGRKVGVSGRLALDEWRNKSDEPRQRYAVVGRVEFLDRPRNSDGVEDRPPEPEPSGQKAGAAEPELALAV